MNREKDLANYALVFFAALSCLFLIFPAGRAAHGARAILSYSLYPSLHYGAKSEYFLRNVPENLAGVLRTDQENRALREKLASMEAELNEARALASENARLTEAAGLSRALPWKGRWARVVSRNPQDWYGSVFIDKGSAQGVEPNASVMAFPGGRAALAGRVYEVYEDFSKVMLVTNPLFSSVASLPGGSDGLAEGRGTWLLRLNYVPEGAQVAEGMEAMTSPAGALFPQGLALGRVSRVYPKESFMNFVTADLAPAAPVGSLKEVYVANRALPAELASILAEEPK